jgi:hypothetical protein
LQNSSSQFSKWEHSRTQHITEKTEADTIESDRMQKLQNKSSLVNQMFKKNSQLRNDNSNNADSNIKNNNNIIYEKEEEKKEMSINVQRNIFKLKLAEEVPISKRLCTKTLDNIFVALYEDLAAILNWQNEENAIEELKKSISNNVNNNNKTNNHQNQSENNGKTNKDEGYSA